ncbi:hypothetical protein CQ057_21760 [Ochrobactrum sp. MYb49]|nr:host attachment protein [Ochrobactrum sp. XJ1]PQZ63962.1 hypothetical protein CQ057_21760 [Ochrobactrum sp. MYb49]
MLDEIMSDRPGRSFASERVRRSAIEYRLEPEKDQEARFADMLVGELKRRLRARESNAWRSSRNRECWARPAGSFRQLSSRP